MFHVSNGELVAQAAFVGEPSANTIRERLLGREKAAASACFPSKQKLRLKIYATQLVMDCGCLSAAFMLANLVRFSDPIAAGGMNLLAALLPVWIISAFNMGAYSTEVLRKPRVGIFRSAIAFMAAVGLVLLTAFLLKASTEFSRLVFAMGAVGGVLFVATARFFVGKYALRRLGGNPVSEAIIVDGVCFPEQPGATLLDAARLGLAPNASDPLMLHRLGTLLHGVDRVLIACKPDRRALWAMLLKGANVQGEVLAEELEEAGALGIGRFGERTTMTVSCGPLDLRRRALKRALDLSITLPIIIFLTPLLLIVAAAIRIESSGPIFFVQKRLGRGNRLFLMMKFRSMRADQCDANGNTSTQRDDQRITRVGRFIRSTSIDELPQLLNVLKGDMSLVGPRPHALGSLAGDKLFWEVDQRYWHRHACKPGITGLAQVRGFRGATHESSDLTNRLRADLEYLAGWSIWRDIAILLRTFRVLAHQNAY